MTMLENNYTCTPCDDDVFNIEAHFKINIKTLRWRYIYNVRFL